MLGSSISKFLKLDNLIENLTGYFETKAAIVKIEVKEELATGLANVIVYMLFAFVFSLVLIFISIGAALVISEQLGSFVGFGIVAAFYLVVGIVLLANNKAIIHGLRKKLMENFNRKK